MALLDILFEDNHLIALNKGNHDLVQGDKTGDTPLSDKVADYIRKKYKKPGNVFLGVPHRVDRPTSGVVLFAKTGKALQRLNRLFQQPGEVTKYYWAVVDTLPAPKSGTLRHYLMRNQRKNKSFAYKKKQTNSKFGELMYWHKASSDRYHLLEIEMLTGRHHQIRAQLAAENVFIKGDLKYGFPRSNKNGGIHLHARKLSFIHPVRQTPCHITAPPPDDVLWNFFVKKVQDS